MEMHSNMLKKYGFVFLSLIFYCSLSSADTETVKTQVRYTVDTPGGQFSDAFYFSPTDYKNLKKSDIESMKQARVSNWIASSKIAVPSPEPTEPQLQVDIDLKIAELADLRQKLNKVKSRNI